MQLKKILMPTDFSDCAETAFDHAIYLAQQFQAELHILHVVVLHGSSPTDLPVAFPDIDDIYSHLEKIAFSEMGLMLGSRKTRMLRIREVQRRGVSAAPAIVDYAQDESVDLIVLGTHGHRGLRRFLLGSVAEEVVRTADCPVVTVRGQNAASTIDKIGRIVVPFDFSADSEWALDTAKELAVTYGSQQIDVVHVIAPPVAPGGMAGGLPMHGTYYTDLSSAVADALEQRMGESKVPIKTHIRQGPAALEIIDFAADVEADLIVLGSHGLTGLSHFLLGSVSERVVRSAHCPVLVLRRPKEVESDAQEPAAIAS